MSTNLYIVPYDFTEVGEKALQYALFLGKHVRTEIKLIYISDSKPKGIQMQKKLKEVAENVNPPAGVTVSSLVKVGSIFTDIAAIAKKEGAQLIIMGTHGAKGLQGVFGSHAMKVVTSAECPFLIVQKETEIGEVANILAPIDLTKESLQVINIAGDLAKIVNANVHVIAEQQSDQILNTRIKNRISIVKKQYEDNNVDATIAFVKHSGSYSKKVMSYVDENKMDLIAIAYHSESFLPQFDKFAQDLITNKPCLPVMILNSKQASALYF